MENCKQLIQRSSYSTISSSPYCDNCINKLEVTRRETEKLKAKEELLKSAAIELPVTHVTSRTNNGISAYNSRDMTSNSKLYNMNSLPIRGNSRSQRDSIDGNLSGYNDKHSQRYIPSVNNSYYSSPTYAGTKEKCLLCMRLYINTSRITGKNNTGFCEDCSLRYGRYQSDI
jgi:hypothetical protein